MSYYTEEPNSDCDYGLFTEMTRPSCLSPRRGLRTTNYGACTLQLDAKQDFSTTGVNDDGWYGVVADGHGMTSRVVDLLRGMDWSSVMSRPRPIEYVVERVRTLGETVRDGSTISIARVKGQCMHVSWLGDSAIEFYQDGKIMWRSPIHSPDVQEEKDSVLRRGAEVLNTDPSGNPLWDLKILGPKVATMVPISNVYLNRSTGRGERLNLTRSLGHNTYQEGRGLWSALRTDAQHYTLSLSPGKSGRLIMGSDGLWDVLASTDRPWLARADITAESIAQLARARWAQEWTYRSPGSTSKNESSPRDTTTKMDRADDVSVVVWGGTG